MLTSSEKRQLKAMANHLNAVFQVGKDGVNNNMIIDILNYLNKNELMKIKILQNSTENSKDTMQFICTSLQAEPVLTIGKVVIVYRRSNVKGVKHILD